MDITRPLLFEIAWEVANKVGGIYTVIKSKAPVTCQEFGDRYCLIGPLSPKTAAMEVENAEPPTEALIYLIVINFNIIQPPLFIILISSLKLL